MSGRAGDAGRLESVLDGSRKIRVVFALDNLGVGGTELNAVRSAERLDRERYEIALVCLQEQGLLRERYERAGIPVRSFPIDRLLSPESLRQGLRLAAFLRSWRPDILHAHDLYTSIFCLPWARLARVPAVIASRRWWTWGGRRDHRLLSKLAYHGANVTLVNSPRVGELVIDEVGLPPDRVTVVPNFVDDSAYAAPPPVVRQQLWAELGVPESATVVGCIANLWPGKDHETLVRACARLANHRPEVHMVFIGEGSTRETLECLAQDLKVAGRVHLAGRRMGPYNLHHLFDISVLASTSEALSNSLLEAMAAARPVVATAVGGTPDAVEDGRTGILVTPCDPRAFAEALYALLSDQAKAARMGDAGFRRVREQFSASEVLAKLEALYGRLYGTRVAAVDRGGGAVAC